MGKETPVTNFRQPTDENDNGFNSHPRTTVKMKMTLPSPSTKGNSGLSAQRRRRQKLLIWGGSTIIVVFFVKVVFESRLAGMFVGETSVDPVTGQTKIRRRPERHHTRADPGQLSTEIDAILEGEYTLIDINVSPSSLQGGRIFKDDDARQPGPYDNFGQASKYKDVMATFCHIDWKLQQRNPSQVPMFRDLQSKSRLCEATTMTVDLYDIVQRSKQYDAKYGDVLGTRKNAAKLRRKSQTGAESTVVAAVPPSGVVFHETRCGSTLMANLLASFDQATVRVYSESPPPVSALRACDVTTGEGGGGCHPKLHRQLIRDVFYMMGRRPDSSKSSKTKSKEEQQQRQDYHVFYKIQSIGVMNVDKFSTAFPTTPWLYIFRETVEIMQSHLAKMKTISSSSIAPSHRPVCARNYMSRRQPPTTMQVIESKHGRQKGGNGMADMTLVDYCAAHLAGLSLSAIQEHDRKVQESGGGDSSSTTSKTPLMSRFVNYASMPSIVWEDILPNHFGIEVSASNIQNMERAATMYSKGRGPKANEEWSEDSTKKKESASSIVVEASRKYVGDIYGRMNQLAKQGEGRKIPRTTT